MSEKHCSFELFNPSPTFILQRVEEIKTLMVFQPLPVLSSISGINVKVPRNQPSIS
jgi:hypothetical protein